MACDNESRHTSSSPSEAHAQLLYRSLEQYNDEQKRRRRPSVILAALLVLFLSSAGGISLAVVLMVKVVEIEAACLSRDLILFAASISLLYICLHIRGARKDYKREGQGPPQVYGHYLHASALVVARLGIGTWIAALVATAIMIARAIPFKGLSGKVPFLNLLICTGAIPSFIIISITIERNPTPFATAAISRNSFLTCRVSEFADDLAADMSVSRRASLHRKQSSSGSVLTLPTEEIFRLGAPKSDEKSPSKPKQSRATDIIDDKTELMAGSPLRATHEALPRLNVVPVSPIPKISDPTSPVVPQPTYYPGGWRAEWNNVAQKVGVSRIPESSTTDASASSNDPSSSSYYGSQYTSTTSHSPTESSNNTPKLYHHRATASTSIASSAARSNLSTVRYATEPEIAVRQPIKVVRNPAYAPPSRPDPVTLLRNAQQAQKARTGAGLKRRPSNFSRPMQRTGSQREIDGEADSGVEMKIPGTFY
ncbi:hypothetical protein HD806DRAFT_523659 [Xylariaceae sp. AK1471]|nr:hypothetical protein HD806DRAFT_523659 [Xylariaceae sp. AK1471]